MPVKPASAVLSRRVFIGAGLAAAAALAVGWKSLARPAFAGGSLTVAEAHKAAREGQIVLIDIRRPDEWAQTGIPEGAHPIDMRRKDFVAALNDLTKSTDAPIALICARGVRSAWLASQLSKAGYSEVINVPEGMLGSREGPGWLKSNLPVRAHGG